MPIAADAFRHHPGLAGKIRDPEQSFFRDLDLDAIDRTWTANGLRQSPRYSDALREAMRRETLAPFEGMDIWVFAYGSLMWDPAVYFSEVRRARLPGYRRSFCLVDRSGARGTAEAPGLMAALDIGPACDGLVFRLDAGTADRESEVIWRREMMAPCYKALFLPVETSHGVVQAMCFVADPEADMIDTGISYADQVRYLATGTGQLGTSREYLENVIAGCRELRIEDPDLEALLAEVDAWSEPGAVPGSLAGRRG
ncbi:gamma-glutamylcyclotransferase [Oceanicella sp. SM1341]|uniref:gamma-glutamylcyclotransferase n=1 Tax=Oceanicella sp. SM1341 TaxID=1548889 RepID=UPI0013007E27|nr:gamma-glutamylcyclotransferase [Oceanicella sp. SM1341]